MREVFIITACFRFMALAILMHLRDSTSVFAHWAVYVSLLPLRLLQSPYLKGTSSTLSSLEATELSNDQTRNKLLKTTQYQQQVTRWRGGARNFQSERWEQEEGESGQSAWGIGVATPLDRSRRSTVSVNMLQQIPLWRRLTVTVQVERVIFTISKRVLSQPSSVARPPLSSLLLPQCYQSPYISSAPAFETLCWAREGTPDTHRLWPNRTLS